MNNKQIDESTLRLMTGLAWLGVLEVFPAETHKWLQGYFNDAMRGDRNPEMKILLLAGADSERRRLFINTITEALGDYASFPEEKYFAVGREHRALDVFKSRASFTEISKGTVLCADKAHTLTVADRLSARKKQNSNISDNYSFKNISTKILIADHLPKVKGWEYSSKKRLKVVEAMDSTEVKFFDGEGAQAELDALVKEKLPEAALFWMVHGREHITVPSRYGDSLPASMRQAELRWHEMK